MNVLHVSTWKRRCGIAGFTESVVDHLARAGVENDVCPLDLPALRTLTSAEFLDDMDRMAGMARGYDLIHVQHEFSFFTGSGQGFETIGHFARLLDSLRAAGRPVVVTFHSGAALSTILPPADAGGPGGGFAAFLKWGLRKARVRQAAARLLRMWRRRVVKHFDGRPGSFRAVVHTPRTRIEMLNSGMAPGCVSVVPLGCDLRDPSYFQIDRAAARRSLRLSPDATLLTMFGFVTAYKGHLPAVQALRKLPPQYHLAIVGGPHPENRFDRTLDDVLAAWEGEDPQRLRVTGFVPRPVVDEYYAATDICLAPFLPSNTAGSASLSWGLSSGKPTIASNIPAFAEIEEAGRCLQLCTPNAVHELAWQIQRLAGDDGLREQLAQNALQYATEQSWPRVIEKLLAVYFEMLGDSEPSRAGAGRCTSIGQRPVSIPVSARQPELAPASAVTL
ncbi:MAG: glycosyltransferase [Planctomycetia bacterium]|nr:glycosyltransferase [Planctomycetia bacterium]